MPPVVGAVVAAAPALLAANFIGAAVAFGSSLALGFIGADLPPKPKEPR